MALLVIVVVAVFVLVVVASSLAGLQISRRRRRGDAASHLTAAPPVATPPRGAGAPAAAPPAPPEAAPLRAPPEPEPAPEPEREPAPAPPRPGFGDRLSRAREQLGGMLLAARSRGRVDAATWDELEEALILADVGLATTTALLDDLKARAGRGELDGSDALVEALKSDLVSTLGRGERSLRLAGEGPSVWLFVGVNGVGKTTTIAKVATMQAGLGRTVVLAAGDTFRAAAAEQLGTWAERVGADVVRGGEGQDPGSVVFDAVQRADARGADLVLADTAGRLHTKANLMDELRKIRRVADRPPGTVTEVLLVLDATTGQNGLVQARQFTEAVGLTGVVLTKLDGTAKGGIVLAVQEELKIPVKLVGVGEKVSDLMIMDPEEFVEALVG